MNNTYTFVVISLEQSLRLQVIHINGLELVGNIHNATIKHVHEYTEYNVWEENVCLCLHDGLELSGSHPRSSNLRAMFSCHARGFKRTYLASKEHERMLARAVSLSRLPGKN